MKKSKKVLRLVQVVLAMLLCGLYALGIPLGGLDIFIAGQPAGYLLNMVFISVLTVTIFKLFFKDWQFGFCKKRLAKGIFVYGLPLLIGSAAIFASYLYVMWPCDVRPNPWEVILQCIIRYILVGLVEEIALRGCVFNALRKGLGDSKKEVLHAVLITSILFSFMHIVGAPKDILLMKLAWTFCAGIAITVVYALSENIWSVIILHGIFDISGIPFWFSSNQDFYAAGPAVLIVNILIASIAFYQFIKFYPNMCYTERNTCSFKRSIMNDAD